MSFVSQLAAHKEEETKKAGTVTRLHVCIKPAPGDCDLLATERVQLSHEASAEVRECMKGDLDEDGVCNWSFNPGQPHRWGKGAWGSYNKMTAEWNPNGGWMGFYGRFQDMLDDETKYKISYYESFMPPRPITKEQAIRNSEGFDQQAAEEAIAAKAARTGGGSRKRARTAAEEQDMHDQMAAQFGSGSQSGAGSGSQSGA